MRRRHWRMGALALVILGIATPAQSGTLLAFGDSITFGGTGDPGGWPAMVAAGRPDWTVVNAGVPGDTTSSIDRLRTRLAEVRPDAVVILMGINDPFGRLDHPEDVPLTPAQTVRNLRVMAATARAAGAEVLILTLTPALCFIEPFCTQHPEVREGQERRQEHGRVVSHALATWRPRNGVRVLDLRDRFTLTGWRNKTFEGLHPNALGERVIADLVLEALP